MQSCRMSDDNYSSQVKVKRSSAGLGLFAEEDMVRNQLIVEYTGKKITKKEADKKGGKYLFAVRKNLIIDGSGRENISRYINHSCKPNAIAEHEVTEDRIYIRAKRLIKAGEEITLSYGKDYVDNIISQIGCKCSICQKN